MLAGTCSEQKRQQSCHLLTWVVDDPAYRSALGTQLNVGEGRRSLARKTLLGQRGELHHLCRGSEDQLSALGLVVRMGTLWNTRKTDK